MPALSPSLASGVSRGVVWSPRADHVVFVGASWTGLCPEFVALSRAGKLQAWNLPLGVLSHLVRDCGAGRPGTLTRIGLATFVDPRERGGKVSGPHQADVVQARALPPQTADRVHLLQCLSWCCVKNAW